MNNPSCFDGSGNGHLGHLWRATGQKVDWQRCWPRMSPVIAASCTDEEGTLTRLKAATRTFVDPAIASHRGRIVKTTGDGMLVEFWSAVFVLRVAQSNWAKWMIWRYVWAGIFWRMSPANWIWLLSALAADSL